MKYLKIKFYPLLLLLLLGATACQQERLYDLERGVNSGSQIESEGVMVLTTAQHGGKLTLSIDAPDVARLGVWIDLNGDGKRAMDRSEDVKLFNTYTEYKVTGGQNRVTIYGDITYLGATSNELVAVDITANRFITTLHLPLNQIKEIDLSQNSGLKVVDLSNNSLTRIDLSANTALESAWLFMNKLSELKLENNRALQLLDCSNNQLSQLDISKNSDLKVLLAYNNQLTSLDVAQNRYLNKLWLFGNDGINEAQYTELITALNKTSTGSLWLSHSKVDEEVSRQALLKGWRME